MLTGVGRCRRCGAPVLVPSAVPAEGACPTCRITDDAPTPEPVGEHLAPNAWTWADPSAAAALRSGDLGTILRTYRRVHALTQEQLAARLGYDKTYISMIETGRRRIRDVPTRRHFASALSIPAHLLGVTDPADSDHAVMIALAESTIRLADLARAGGRAAEAVNELWPLVARLQARAVEGRLEADTLAVLARAWTSLGVCLGTVLPEERLHVAVAWTAKAVAAARRLDDDAVLAHALTMHGNELRKDGQHAPALAAFDQALIVAGHGPHAGPALALLARAAAEAGAGDRFHAALTAADDLLDRHGPASPLQTPYTHHEIHLRGLLDLGDLDAATALAHRPPADPAPAPQWEIIAAITHAYLLLATGDHETAGRQLTRAVEHAATRRLPHQLQRILRAATRHAHPDLAEQAQTALDHLRGRPALTRTGEHDPH
jgi:transcriptional regulator with XRE-family HTH domain